MIFSATGDLTKRLVVPALYNLSRSKMLPEKFALIGVARADEFAASWRDHLHDMLKSMVGNTAAGFNIDHIDEAAWRGLTEKMLYVRGDLAMLELYEKLRDAINEVGIADGVPGNVIFYLAIADRFFGVVADQLGNAKLERDLVRLKHSLRW